MKYFVKVDNQLYEVEIKNLHQRPIIAVIGDVEIEVSPEGDSYLAGLEDGRPNKISSPVLGQGATPPTPSGVSDKIVRAPIPGTILSVKVNVGDIVTIGQELCILEAMKMRNTIRAGRNGKVAVVHTSAGQSVNHNDLLIEFEE